jgi:GxxExxY protein
VAGFAGKNSDTTETILKCCFQVMNTLGSGFLESVYRNSLVVALTNQGLKVTAEKGFEVVFLEKKVGIFVPDLIVEDEVIVELKCCQNLSGEHQAQLINYLAVTKIEIGLLVNFGNRKLEFKRVYHPSYPAACDPAHPVQCLNSLKKL